MNRRARLLEESLQRLIADQNIADTVVAPTNKVSQHVRVFPIGDPLRQTKLWIALWNCAPDETLRSQVLQEKRQAIGDFGSILLLGVEPVLVSIQ